MEQKNSCKLEVARFQQTLDDHLDQSLGYQIINGEEPLIEKDQKNQSSWNESVAESRLRDSGKTVYEYLAWSSRGANTQKVELNE